MDLELKIEVDLKPAPLPLFRCPHVLPTFEMN
jgi:hypothetical protein